jgi:demethylmenaquinone methyltransferase/2-methoxy-6-polyprenyl-1,4-benzoquinol methylase
VDALDPANKRTTHFGYREVPESEKAGLVGEVFRSVANKYDLMNDLMSFGVHRLWKRFAVGSSGVRRGQSVLDVAGGSGDLAALFAERVGREGRVVLSDINPAMLEVGRGRLIDRGIAGNVEFALADAEALPFPDDSFDCVSIGFGLRNVTHIDKALASMFRVLKPGGRLLVLEFSKPVLPVLDKVYDAYSFGLLPLLGRVVANDGASYRYLAESIRRFPDQETLKGLMQAAGFERVHYFNLTGGIVALHKGYKL